MSLNDYDWQRGAAELAEVENVEDRYADLIDQ